MTKFYNVCTPVEGSDNKTRFQRVGVAFPNKEDAKSIMSIRLFATPINGELVLFEPKQNETPDDEVVE